MKGDSSFMVSSSTWNIFSASSKLHGNTSSCRSEDVGMFKVALDSVSARQVHVPKLL